MAWGKRYGGGNNMDKCRSTGGNQWLRESVRDSWITAGTIITGVLAARRFENPDWHSRLADVYY